MAKKEGKESIIGKVIYGFLMFAPLLAVLTSCAYSIFNKNATEEIKRTEVINPSTLDTNKTYHWSNESPIYSDNEVTIQFSEITNIETTSTKVEYTADYKAVRSLTDSFYLYTGPNGLYVHFIGKFDFKPTTNVEVPQIYTQYITETITYTETRDLRNTFYYSIDRLQEENIFTWAKNNEIYDGLKYVCNELSIENDFFPMILSYWLIISLIYFMYDILLIIFHILHNNIHKLEQM